MVKKLVFFAEVVVVCSLCSAQTVSGNKSSGRDIIKGINFIPTQKNQGKRVQLVKPEVRIQASASVNLSEDGQRFLFSNSDTLKNDDDIPQWFFSDIDYNASRFSPARACTLKEAMVAFTVPSDSFFVSQNCSLFVWDNLGNNTPGERQWAGVFSMPSISPGYYGWIILDISSDNLIFTSDFWIGYKKVVARPPLGLSDGTASLPNRNMWRSSLEDPWRSWTEGDFLIRAIVTYEALTRPEIALSATTHDFGDVKVGDSSDWVLAVSNTGEGILSVSNISSDRTEFSANPTSFNVASGGSQNVTVTFAPVSVGEVSGILTITSNDPDNGTLQVSLSGNGYIEDTTPPEITFESSSVSLPDVGNSAPISDISITDVSGVDKAYLFYRKGGAAAYDSLELQKTDGTNYSGTVPASSVTPRGLEYYIMASDTSNNISTSPSTEPETNPHILLVIVPNLTKSLAQPARSYRMISVPISLDNSSPDAVLVDDLGSYDNTKWRLFRYQGTDYVEYTVGGIEGFDSGKGFWLITKDAKTIDSGSGKSVTTASNFTISLQPGWNMIGNPFDFNINWNEVIRDDAVEESLWGYDGQDYIDKTRLVPWEGYFIKNLESYTVNIEIPPSEATGLARPASEFLAKSSRSEGEWSIQIRAQVGHFCDSRNYIGSLGNSRAEWDKRDLSEPPQAPGDYVCLYFPHHEWERYPGVYTADFRPVLEEGDVWDFKVDTNIPDANGLLEFKNLTSLQDNFEVCLLDKALRVAVDLKSNNQYAFKAHTSRKFSIIVGTKEFIEDNNEGISSVPDEYALWQNYPNPFNSTTSIKYELPKPSKVTLKIYNIMGQEVTTLVNEYQDAGYRTVYWDASEVSSGIYFCQIQAEEFMEVRKMVMMK